MTDFTREEIRSQLNRQGFDPPEPEFTEVVYRINALIEGLKKLDDLDERWRKAIKLWECNFGEHTSKT